MTTLSSLLVFQKLWLISAYSDAIVITTSEATLTDGNTVLYPFCYLRFCETVFNFHLNDSRS